MTTTIDEPTDASIDTAIETTINKLFPKEKPINVEFLIAEQPYAIIELTTKGDLPRNTVMINIDIHNGYFKSKDLGVLIELLTRIKQELEADE